MKTPALESIFNKVTSLRTCNVIKKRFQDSNTGVFRCKIFKNTYFKEHLQTAAYI